MVEREFLADITGRSDFLRREQKINQLYMDGERGRNHEKVSG